jgi:hypothetical protein
VIVTIATPLVALGVSVATEVDETAAIAEFQGAIALQIELSALKTEMFALLEATIALKTEMFALLEATIALKIKMLVLLARAIAFSAASIQDFACRVVYWDG